jgi:hypothetical protein
MNKENHKETIENNNNMSIIWASCFLEKDDKIYEHFESISKILRNNGVDLVLFTQQDLSGSGREISSVQVPFYIAEMGVEFSEYLSGEALPAASGILGEFIAADQAWGLERSIGQAQLDCLRAAMFWEQAFQLMQPSAILSWGSTAPLSRMWSFLARRFQRPHFFIERGVLENTLSYSIAGQGCLSDFSTALSMVDPNREGDYLDNLWGKIENYYRNIEYRHYSRINNAPNKAQIEYLETAKRPHILYLGSYDIGSGASFDHSSLGDIHAPWIKKSADGAEALRRCLETIPDFSGTLTIKPHLGSDFSLEGNSSIPTRFFRDIDVYDLIDSADVVVTMTSSTAFIALMKGIPTVTLANIQFMGQDITYEARTDSELRDAIISACDKTDWDNRRNKGKRFIAGAFRDFLIGLDQDVPTRFKLADLAQLLSRFRQYTPPNLSPSKDRLALFGKFIAQARNAQFLKPGQEDLRNFARERIELQRMLDEARLETANLKSLLAQQATEIATLQQQRHKIDDKLKSFERVADELSLAREEESRRNIQIRSLESDLLRLNIEKNEFEKNQIKTNHELNSCKIELDRSFSEISAIKNDIFCANQKISDLSNENYILNSSVESYKSKVNLLNNQIELLKESSNSLEKHSGLIQEILKNFYSESIINYRIFYEILENFRCDLISWQTNFSVELEKFNENSENIDSSLVSFFLRMFAEIEKEPLLRLQSRRARMDKVAHIAELSNLMIPADSTPISHLDAEAAVPASLPARLVHIGRFTPPPFPSLELEARPARPATEVDESEYALVKASGLFDPDWYLSTYPDVLETRMDPVRHYLWIGAALGYQPSPQSDASCHLAEHLDTATSHKSSLIHFLINRKSEAGTRQDS